MELHEPADADKKHELRAFGTILRRVRKEKEISQEQLGWRTDTDQKYISELERGLKDPGFRIILKLLRGLDVPLHQFMAEVERALQHDPHR